MTYGDCACDILGDICDIPLSQRRGGGGYCYLGMSQKMSQVI